MFSCASKNPATADNLPKDISEKPGRDSAEIADGKDLVKYETLTELQSEIDSLINSETCEDANDWKFSPFGAKPCGGAASYVAYPIDLESEILPKIEQYNTLNDLYNKQQGLMSDCAVVTPPTGIRCENGTAVLVYDNSSQKVY